VKILLQIPPFNARVCAENSEEQLKSFTEGKNIMSGSPFFPALSPDSFATPSSSSYRYLALPRTSSTVHTHSFSPFHTLFPTVPHPCCSSPSSETKPRLWIVFELESARGLSRHDSPQGVATVQFADHFGRRNRRRLVHDLEAAIPSPSPTSKRYSKVLDTA
jgi:hypothetical protein